MVAESIPQPIRNLLWNIGFDKLWPLLVNKYDVELYFQQKWVKEFAQNKEKVLEYWVKYRFLDEIKRVCEINDDKKILDIGCGISTVLHFINGERYGIDPLANEYLGLYKYPKDITIKYGLGENIPFQDQFFDIILCSNALDHNVNPHQTIQEIYRVLKDNGFFVLTVELFETEGPRDLAHPHSFTIDYLQALLGKKFRTVFKNTSPWIGLRQYVQGGGKSDTEESVMICQKLSCEKRESP
jgi:ubiquinone/menaquinone biosynthesis C-methylase UbiE